MSLKDAMTILIVDDHLTNRKLLRAQLEGEGLAVDYAVLRRSEDLAEPEPGQRHGLTALIAAKLGRARLIDNLSTDL